MNAVHLYIVVMCGAVGLGFALGSLWKGFVYTLFGVAALAFWYGVFVALHALVS